MADPDLNLLVALDALLAERSVTGAARRLGLSTSAMSRTLARLRRATGDELLVPAGRTLVPTTYGEALAERVHGLTREARAVLSPAAAPLDLAALDRIFTIRANEVFVEVVAAPLVAAIHEAAPKVRLRFVTKPDKDAQPLRDGLADLEIGVLGTTAPELRTRLLFRDRFVGVCRTGHKLLSGAVTAERFAACGHVVASRRGTFTGPVDAALETLGLERSVIVAVPTYSNAMQIARRSDLVALVTQGCLGNRLVGDHAGDMGLASFELPVETPDVAISMIWHPRLDADPAHAWLRETLVELCRAAYG